MRHHEDTSQSQVSVVVIVSYICILTFNNKTPLTNNYLVKEFDVHLVHKARVRS